MKILYASSEAAPFAKSGGLADVAGALPKALVRDGIDCRVVMPLYNDLKFKDTLTYVTNFSVPVGWRSQYCGLFRAERDGVTFYFLDNEYYFKRSGLYGFYDDGERFAFFARAILEMLFYTDFEPDIINCNDWQTALTPVYLNLYYRHLDKFNRIKTVFTIHNIAYQGKYGLEILEDTCGIGKRDAHVVEYDGCANFMKGAIETADKITTVSPTYAGEILDPWFSHGLDGLLRQKQYKLCGILNGIDVDVFNPATDPDIAQNYDVNTFQEGKAVCKAALQDEMGLNKDGSPVMAMVTRLVGHKGVDLVRSIAEGLLQHGHALTAALHGHGHGLHAGLVGQIQFHVLHKADAAGELGIHAHGRPAQIAHEEIRPHSGKHQDQQHGDDVKPGRRASGRRSVGNLSSAKQGCILSGRKAHGMAGPCAGTAERIFSHTRPTSQEAAKNIFLSDGNFIYILEGTGIFSRHAAAFRLAAPPLFMISPTH